MWLRNKCLWQDDECSFPTTPWHNCMTVNTLYIIIFVLRAITLFKCLNLLCYPCYKVISSFQKWQISQQQLDKTDAYPRPLIFHNDDLTLWSMKESNLISDKNETQSALMWVGFSTKDLELFKQTKHIKTNILYKLQTPFHTVLICFSLLV